ncbi:MULTISPECIES: hypothetical protein [unclassified Pseudoalteromonas]|uniref:hypothetical protein n=1 Tax=unclassified Pseudoalteromonas TaxID=194690 RepID=UPI003863073C
MAMNLIDNLITKKKYKKAHQLIKKQAKQGESLKLLEQEVICCFYLKQLKQSVLIYKRLLGYNIEASKKVGFLNNLAITYNRLKQPNLVQATYLQSINLDASAHNAFAREQYCIAAIQNSDFSQVLEHVEPLLGLAAYSDNAHVMQLDAAIYQQKRPLIDALLKTLAATLSQFKDKHVAILINVLIKHNYKTQLKTLFIANENRFKATVWYDELVNQSSEKTLITNNNTLPGKCGVEGSNKALVNSIKKLIDSSEQAGAFFSPLIKIMASDAGLSIITTQPVVKNTLLLDIPISCMPLLCDYSLSVENNILVCKAHKQQHNPNANTTMSLMIDIYNQTNKLKEWQVSSPFFSLSDYPMLLSALVEGKKNTSKVIDFYRLSQEGRKDKLLIESFFGARVFSYKNEKLKNQGIKSVSETEKGLLSVIDFVNHRIGSTYYRSTENGIGLTAPANQLIDSELFVQYNYFDPLGTLLIYGFVDLSSPYLFSVPVNMQLSDGREAQVLGNNPFGNETVSDSGKHLAKYVPNITKINNGITLDSLSIPDITNINQLRDVLTTVAKSVTLNDNLTDTALMAEVYSLEKQLLQLNLKYWYHLEWLFEQQNNVPVIASEQLESLIGFAKKHISQYANHFGVALF